MAKRYRKKTELETALSPVVSMLGRMPLPKELMRMLGGDPSGWGRILKGQQRISGEYHARLKLLKCGIDSAQFELQAAERNKRYGEQTRKGKIAPHTKNIYYDLNEFNAAKIAEKIMQAQMNRDPENFDFDDACHYGSLAYLDLVEDIQLPRTFFEEQELRRDFLESLP